MFKKEDFIILSKMSESLFSSHYLIKTCNLPRDVFFELRKMQKTQIIQYEETKLVFFEKKIRQDMRHPFLINILYTFQDYDCLFLVTEMAKGGYLYHYLRSSVFFTKEIVQFYVAEILIAIQYLHKKNLFYNLLIPDNIMLDEAGHIKLRYDFCNLSGMSEETYKKNIEYICVDYVKDKAVNKSSDYWCLGIVMYEMLFGMTPFRGSSYDEIVNNILNKRIKFLNNIDESTAELLYILLDKHAFRRIGKNEDEALLLRKCSFFKGIDWDLMEKRSFKPPLQMKNMIESYKNGVNMARKFCNYFDRKDNDGYGETFVEYTEIESGVTAYCMNLDSR